MIGVFMFGLPGLREFNPATAFVSGNRNLKLAPGLHDFCPTPLSRCGSSLFVLSIFIHATPERDTRQWVCNPNQE
jgi:hypothetical protein